MNLRIMHILRQLFWFKLAGIGAVVFFTAFGVFCILEMQSVAEAEAWTDKTNDTLDAIADAELAMHLADFAGWNALLNPNAAAQVDPFRNAALERLKRLLEHANGEESQRVNFAAVSAALKQRFILQDAQRASVKRVGNTLVFDLPVVEKAVSSGQEVDQAFARTRFDERALLIHRTEARNETHRRLITGLMLCALLSIVCSLALIIRMVKELSMRKEVARLIGKRKPGELAPWMQEINDIIEGAERDRANIKNYLIAF